jgi:hypothetical protein
MASIYKNTRSRFYYCRYKSGGRSVRISTKTENPTAAQDVADRMEKEAWLTDTPDGFDHIKEEFIRWLVNRGVPEKVIVDWLDRQQSSSQLASQLQRLERQITEIRDMLVISPRGLNT